MMYLYMGGIGAKIPKYLYQVLSCGYLGTISCTSVDFVKKKKKKRQRKTVHGMSCYLFCLLCFYCSLITLAKVHLCDAFYNSFHKEVKAAHDTGVERCVEALMRVLCLHTFHTDVHADSLKGLCTSCFHITTVAQKLTGLSMLRMYSIYQKCL